MNSSQSLSSVSASENSTTLAIVPTAPAVVDEFMYTPEFRRHFVDFVHVQTLMALRVATKGFNVAADVLIDEGVRSGKLMVHGGNDLSHDGINARKERHKLVTRVIFLLNVTKVGQNACYCAVNLVIVDIPEGVESIGHSAFAHCRSLTTVSFPKTLSSIGTASFFSCSSLDNVDLLHTNLQKLGRLAFAYCSELKSMTIPDSLQTLGYRVFEYCSKLVSSNINDRDNDAVVAHLRSKQQQKEAERIQKQQQMEAERVKQENNDARARRLQHRQAHRENV